SRRGRIAPVVFFLLEEVDHLAAQLQGGRGKELVADRGKTRAEIEADVVDVALEGGLLVEAPADQVAAVVFFLDDLDLHLRQRQQGRAAQDGAHALAEALRVAQLGNKSEGGQRLFRLLSIRSLRLMSGDEAVIRSGLPQQRAHANAGEELA